MSAPFSDKATSWSGLYLTDASGAKPGPGGLILQDVRHDGHSFAHELRLVGLRLKVEQVDTAGAATPRPSIFLALSDPPFTVGTIRLLTPTPISFPSAPGAAPVVWLREASEALQFESYFKSGTNHVAYGVAADFHLPDSWFTAQLPNCEVSHLWVDQRTLFSRLSNTPPHEPSGALQAARCHPIVKYAFTANPTLDRTKPRYRIVSIRFDYRLALRLDQFSGTVFTSPPLAQSAGLFRDNDTAGPSRSMARAAFAAIEKPLVLEVWSYGLSEGTPTVGPRTTLATADRTWDNLHWWGAQPPGSPIIQAPGAAHAAHCHWRWGGAGYNVRSRIPEIDTGGVPTSVEARQWGRGAARVLVDPAIWIQTIRVAIVKNMPALDPATSGVTLESLARERWQDLFTGLRTTPDDIYVGADVVFWYSTEVHASTTFPAETSGLVFTSPTPASTVTSALGGSVFLHGFFFAHGPPLSGATVGSDTPEHWPRDPASLRASPVWYRPGN